MNLSSIVQKVKDAVRKVTGGAVTRTASVGKWFATHKKPIAFTVVAVAIVSIGTYALLPAPRAEGALKGRRVEIYRNAEMRVSFSQQMNPGSVERAWKLTPAVRGNFRWEQNMVIFKPSEPLEKGKDYELEIADSAHDTFGKRLKETFRQTFAVLDYPEVATAIPSDYTVVRQTQTITVLFDHPMRVLSMKDVPPEVLRLEPAVKGAFHWLGTSGFEFVPEGDLAPATTFTATVPKGTKMADGSTTVEDKTWKFSTAPVQVYREYSRSRVKPDEALTLEFNYPVPAQAVRAALSVKEREQGISSGEQDPRPVDMGGISVTADPKDATRLFIRKAGGFALGMEYFVSLPQGFTGGVGPNGLPSMWTVKFETYEKMLKLESAESETMNVSSGPSEFYARFNNPLPKKIPAGWVTVSPALEDLEINSQGDYWYDDNQESTNIWIRGLWKPSTKYTITLSNAVADVFGQKLGAKTITVETYPYRSGVTLSTYARNGVMAAHLPRLYQMRSMNAPGEWKATVCSGSAREFIEEGDFSCGTKGELNYRTDGDLNRYKINDLDLDKIAGKALPVGFYRLDVKPLSEKTKPADPHSYVSGWEEDARSVAVIDTALTLKQDNAGNLLVWATDLKTGNPVAGLAVEAFSALRNGNAPRKAESRAKGTTDAQGVVTLKTDGAAQTSFYVVADGKGHLGVSSTDWNDGIGPWSYGLEEQWASRTDALIGYVYTDRRIYRSDHTVQFKGIVRQDRDAMLAIPKAREVAVTIMDPNGEVASTQNVGISSFGTFWGSFQLDVSRPLGAYQICAHAAEANGDVCGSFEVREYRRPDFKVEVGVPQGMVVAGPQADIRIHGEYYHGAPLANAKAYYTVTRTPSYFSPASLWTEWYSYALDDGRSYCYWYCRANGEAENVANGELILDAQGNASVRIPTTAGSKGTPMDYAVNVTIEDVNARSVSGNASFTAHPADLYAGIRSNYDKGWSDPEAAFDVITVGADGNTRPNTPVKVTLSKRVWKSIQKEGPGGEMRWESSSEDTVVTTKDATTDDKGKAFVSFGSQQDGLYVAKVEAKDSAGRTAAASSERYMYTYSGDAYGSSWYGFGVTDDRQMKILQTKAEYQPGETAVLAVQSPYPSAKALVTVERDSIRSSKVVTLDAKTKTVSIPLGDDAVPNVFVSVVAVKGGGDKEIPDFKMGYAQLQVGTSKKVLNLEVKADKTEYRPGDTATLTVKASTQDGKPAQAEASLAIVDERVVDLLGPVDKNVLQRFYFPRKLGVITSQSLTMLVKKVFFDTPEGGDGKGGGAASPIRGNFLDTAYWKADVTTGADGTATVQVKLPDNLTNWQVLMIGTTKDTVVGSAETEFKTRKTLMVEPTLPRIMRVGDTLTIGGMVQNGTSEAIEATVTLEAKGVTISSGREQRVTVPPNGRLPVRWQIAVPDGEGADKANFTIRVSGGGLEDGVTMDIPVLPAAQPDIIGTSGILDQTVTERLDIPEDASKARGALTVAVTPSLGDGLKGSVDYLLDYHYGCAEQTTSAVLASVAYSELAKTNIITANPENLKKAEEKVKGGVAKLRGMMGDDGGVGFWSSGDTKYPHLTAYVFWGLTRAKAAGFEVDDDFLNGMDGYLRRYLEGSASKDSSWIHLSDDEKAQVLFALSERNTNGLDGFAQSLYERRGNLSSFAKSFLAMAISNIESGSSARSGALLDEVKNRVITLERFGAYVDDGSGYDYFMSSPLRSTAIALMMYQRLSPNDQMNERLMRYLLSERRDGYWHSTQATAMSLLALTDYAKNHPVDTSRRAVNIFVDNDRKATLDFPQGDRSPGQSYSGDFSQLAKAASTHEVGIEKDGGNRAFYDITLKTYRPFDKQEPVENGFTVLSGVYALTDEKNANELRSVTQGENVRVHLKILVPKKHQYVAVEYHLPAGLEAVDFTLNTSPKEIAGEQKNCSPSWGGRTVCYENWEMDYWWGNVWKHTEYRDDRVFLFAENLSPGVYEYDVVAQAVTPGTFHAPAAQAFEFYHPEVRGTSAVGMFTVNQK